MKALILRRREAPSRRMAAGSAPESRPGPCAPRPWRDLIPTPGPRPPSSFDKLRTRPAGALQDEGPSFFSRRGFARPGQSKSTLAAGIASLLALLFAGLAFAALTFPELTGRVVDQANVLSPAARERLTAKLADLEQKSGIQLVVATVSSLQDQDIEPYANELFRSWKLGEKTKNNGVLLLVAPKEHRVRIEVGYGLEGTLTDALSRIIIANAIAPRFKVGDFDGGVTHGVDDIITVLTTDAGEWEKKPSLRMDVEPLPDWLRWLITAALIAFVTAFIISPGFRWLALNVLLNILVNSGPVRGGGGLGGGGFGGGGGSSGGGGASGSW